LLRAEKALRIFEWTPNVGHAIEFFQADAKSDEATITLNNVSSLMQTASELYEPIIPDGARRAIESLRKGEKVILFPRI
jgi:hypothetical protein